MIRTLVAEAVAAGARRWKACEMLGIAVRTLERWDDDREDGRHGPKSEPANKLSATERQRIVDVATSAEFRDESPKQIFVGAALARELIGIRPLDGIRLELYFGPMLLGLVDPLRGKLRLIRARRPRPDKRR